MEEEPLAQNDSAEYKVRDRRPMGPREWGVSRWAAAWLAERNIWPDLISVASVCFAVAGGCAWWLTGHVHNHWAVRLLWLAGAVVVELRAACNLLDGMVAVQRRRASALGELYNEVPDRVSDVAMLVGLGGAVTGSVTLGWAAAVVAVGVAYVRAQAAAAGAGQDYGGPMAKPARMQWWLMAGLHAVVVPCHLVGCFDALPPGSRPPRPTSSEKSASSTALPIPRGSETPRQTSRISPVAIKIWTDSATEADGADRLDDKPDQDVRQPPDQKVHADQGEDRRHEQRHRRYHRRHHGIGRRTPAQ